MIELHFPWLEVAALIPAAGAVYTAATPRPDRARLRALWSAGLTLACALAAWEDFTSMNTLEAHDKLDVLSRLIHTDLFVVDELSAPLLPLGALVFFLTILATLRAKSHQFSFARALVSESILLATLSCKQPWPLIACLAIGMLPPYLELRALRRPTRVYVIHMVAFVGLLLTGQILLTLLGYGHPLGQFAVFLIAVSALIRSGVAPVHCWMPDLFENATFGTALLFVTPMVGVYALARLVLPQADPWVLQAISLASLATAFYAAGMALVQRDGRRFFCYLFLSHSSLVLVGIESATPVGLAGALCLWLSVTLALTGFGLTMRGVESRTGPVSLGDYLGLHAHVPMLATSFLITGLASVGFPGTIGFVGLELLIEGVVRASALAETIVVIVSALNGLAVMHAYFRIFTGKVHKSSIDLRVRVPERVAVLVLITLILAGGIFPQPGVANRYHAAVSMTSARPAPGMGDTHGAAAPRSSEK